MWDYDKLFAEGNIVGLKNVQQNRIFPSPVDGREYWGKEGYVDWRNYYNESLSTIKDKDQEYTFEVMYVVRLDEHGNVIEKLFDREEDMPKPMPKLETGMFVRVNGYDGSRIGFVDAENNHVIYQEGGYDFIDNNDIISCGIATQIVEIYGKDTLAYDFCTKRNLIWYKSKSN